MIYSDFRTFTFIALACLIKEKYFLASVLARYFRVYQYAKNYQNTSNGLSAAAIFFN